ncbi:MAG: alpha/beta hydrolase fold domain-containing protein [Rhizobiales bacterium]|nr:alpha/beta hydrolase fold domain-containing protein [Hyphomicrobiales bacterium]
MSEPTAAVRRILAMLAAMPTDKRPVAALTPDEARRRTRTIWADFWSAAPPMVEDVRDHVVETAEGAIPVRLYDPASDGRHPIFYFHGGGFVVGDLDTHDGIARRLALYSGRPVVRTDYRRAPEHP